jgi:hypothetical protein
VPSLHSLFLLFCATAVSAQKKQSKNSGQDRDCVSANIHTQTEQEALIEPNG